MERLLLPLVLLSLAAPANARDSDLPGFYVGGAIGRGNVQLEDTDTPEDFDSNDTSFKLIAGYRIIDWVAVEVNYASYGQPDDTVFGLGLEAELDALSASAIGLLPLGDFDLFARGGLAYWDVSLRASRFGTEVSEDNVDPLFGFGAQYRAGNVAIRLEWEAMLLGIDDDGDDEADGDDWADMLTLGLTYKF
jgi:hypothetical protein